MSTRKTASLSFPSGSTRLWRALRAAPGGVPRGATAHLLRSTQSRLRLMARPDLQVIQGGGVRNSFFQCSIKSVFDQAGVHTFIVKNSRVEGRDACPWGLGFIIGIPSKENRTRTVP